MNIVTGYTKVFVKVLFPSIAPPLTAISQNTPTNDFIDHISNCPNEMLIEFFKYLPIQSLGRAASVCKKFQITQCSPQIWKVQAQIFGIDNFNNYLLNLGEYLFKQNEVVIKDLGDLEEREEFCKKIACQIPPNSYFKFFSESTGFFYAFMNVDTLEPQIYRSSSRDFNSEQDDKIAELRKTHKLILFKLN
jgi:hypothetical protein